LLIGGASAAEAPNGLTGERVPPAVPETIGPDFGRPLTPYAYRARGGASLPVTTVTPPAVATVPPATAVKPPDTTLPTPRFDPSGQPALSVAFPATGSQVAEGVVTFVWHTAGPIVRVKLSYSGERCRLGGQLRGNFSGDFATVQNSGTARVRVPWLDGTHFTLRLTGYDANGRSLATTEARYELLPEVCQGKPGHALVVCKSRQRLYYLRDGRIVRMHMVSTGARGSWTPVMSPGSYDRKRGAMGRVFRKSTAPVSRLYQVVMRYYLAITSSGSHGIHATSPNYYRRLGGPASHGCIRQHLADARTLYQLVPVGTPVYVR
jgi:lipoprotein-anchoring transpeptidase ErfK/SrfK